MNIFGDIDIVEQLESIIKNIKENKEIVCYTATFDEEDIKSIVTREQFEQMQYKVGE